MQAFHTTPLTWYTPRGIRIPVASVKGRCPRPLDDGGLCFSTVLSIGKENTLVKYLLGGKKQKFPRGIDTQGINAQDPRLGSRLEIVGSTGGR